MSTEVRDTDEDLPPELALHRPREPGPRRRRWRRIRRRLRVPAAILGVLAVLGGGTWIVGWTPVLDSRSVSVDGTATLDPSQVLAAARVPLGVPLARLDTTAIADRVATLAPVRSVTVTRQFPHRVVIRLTERTPAALLVGDSGVIRIVDTTGALYPPPGGVPTDLPVIVDSGVALDAAAVESAVTVLDALPAAVGAEVTAVVVADDDAVLLDLGVGARTRVRDARRTVVRWGTAANTPEKARVLAAVLAVTHDPWIDLSAAEVPVTRATIPSGALPEIPAVGRAAS